MKLKPDEPHPHPEPLIRRDGRYLDRPCRFCGILLGLTGKPVGPGLFLKSDGEPEHLADAIVCPACYNAMETGVGRFRRRGNILTERTDI